MPLFKKFTIKDFTKERYMALVRSHPYLQEERNQLYLMLILTFLSLSFLGIVAINPTLTTIVELNKKLEDSTFVNQALSTKIANLSSLNTQYQTMTDTWPIIDFAIPNNPHVVPILAQVQAIAKDTKVALNNLQSFEVEVANQIRRTQLLKEGSFAFTVTATGTKNNLLQFAKTISNFNRIAVIESINYSVEEEHTVTIRARAYFVP